MEAGFVVSMCGGRHWRPDYRASVAKFLGGNFAPFVNEWRTLTETRNDLSILMGLLVGIVEVDISGVVLQNLCPPDWTLDAVRPPEGAEHILRIRHVSTHYVDRRKPLWGTWVPDSASTFLKPVDLAIIFDDPVCESNETPVFLDAMRHDAGPRRAMIVCENERRGPISFEAALDYGIAPSRIWPMHPDMFKQRLPLLLGDLRSSAPRVYDA